MKRGRALVWWVLMILWAAQMFHFSTAAYDDSASRSMIETVLSALGANLGYEAVDALNAALRKFAHISEYAIFSLLLYKGLLGRSDFAWRPYIASFCVIAAAAYSLTDEFHQLFVPGRRASLMDCVIDTAGSIAAMVLVYLHHARQEANV